MKAVVLLVAVLACLVVIDARTLGARHAAPKGWTKQTRALPHHPIKFMVALNQRNLDVLESTFWSVSDPRSPFYQQFLTQEEVLKIVAPPQDEHDKVFLWLANSGAKNIKSYGDAIEAVAPVKTVEKLFSTKMFHFTHADGRKIVRQWGSFSVPREISSFVHMVSGLSEFPVPHLKFHAADGALGVSPQTIQSVYGTPANYKATNSSQGVIEFEDQYFTPADLQTFATQFGVSIPALPASHIIGNNQPGEPGDEAELDIQYIAGVGLGVDNYFWIEADPNWLYGFAVHFFSTKVVPLVISVSYGWSEADQCEQGIGAGECQQLGVDSHGFVSRVNAEFQKIGVRGISILVASGDSGANGRTDGGCTGPTLLPDYPAASPYVTSVGATEIHNPVYNLPSPPPGCVNAGYSCASGGLEAAVSFAQANFASGGGFSNVAGRPSYQDAAVSAYLASGVALPPASYFNATSRGYPDIAAFGSAVLIVDGGSVQAVGGTSCSAPIVGGVVGLLNDYQIKKTGKPLGFLNPLLYQIFESDPSAFTDVTIGDNKCTEDGCSDSCQGFLATKGWYPVTGLGTPKYQAILAYLEKLNTQRGF